VVLWVRTPRVVSASETAAGINVTSLNAIPAGITRLR